MPTKNNTLPTRHSPTSLRVFETCAKQYEYAYVERAAGRERPSPELVFGNALHEALAFLFRVPSHERSVEVVHRALRH